MELSNAAQITSGVIILTVPAIQYGGLFLLSQLQKPTIIKTAMRAAFFRAGHAHAGVLVILALLAQIFIDNLTWGETATGLLRTGFGLAPILIPAGFFFSMIGNEDKPNRLIILMY